MPARALSSIVNAIVPRLLEIAGPTFAPPRALARIAEYHCIVADLDADFDGYTIVVLSDFHHRHPFNQLHWLRHAVESANAVSPDLIALLGDYASSFKQSPVMSLRWYVRALPAMAGELRRLRARDGVIAVLDNHDY